MMNNNDGKFELIIIGLYVLVLILVGIWAYFQ